MKRNKIIRTLVIALGMVSLPVLSGYINIGGEVFIAEVKADTVELSLSEPNKLVKDYYSTTAVEDMGSMILAYVHNWEDGYVTSVWRASSASSYKFVTTCPDGTIKSAGKSNGSYIIASNAPVAWSKGIMYIGVSSIQGSRSSFIDKYDYKTNEISTHYTGTPVIDSSTVPGFSKNFNNTTNLTVELPTGETTKAYGGSLGGQLISTNSQFGCTGNAVVPITRELTFRPKLNITATFNYKTSLGVAASKKVSADRITNFGSQAPEPPKDTMNYMKFIGWDKEFEDTTQSIVYNAVYEESDDSFWVGTNRYGIIDNSKVYFLGSKEEDIEVPQTVEKDGTIYGVILQNGFDTRHENIKNIKIPSSAFTNSNVLSATSAISRLEVYGDSGVIPDSFASGKPITQLDLSKYSGIVGSRSFANCKLLEEIQLGKTSQLGTYVFSGCTKLKSIDIPETITSIGSYAFYECSSLDSITGTGNYTTLSDSTFRACTSLKYIELPNTCKSVSTNAFYGSSVEVVKLSQEASNTTIASQLNHRVFLYNPDGTEVIASFWVKTGTNMSSFVNKFGTGWTRVDSSGSLIGNITKDSEFICTSLNPDVEKLQAPMINISNQLPKNRENIVATLQ